MTQSHVPVIAIHGGAGTISAATTSAEQAQAYHDALKSIVAAAQSALLKGMSALDATCLAVEMLEDCPLFTPATARCSRTTKPMSSTPP